MKVEVWFDVKDEFEISLGDMKGIVELGCAPARGAKIDIASGRQTLRNLGLPPAMEVMGVEQRDPCSGRDWLVLLEDLYVMNVETGRPLIRALEDELGLFLFPYHPGLE